MKYKVGDRFEINGYKYKIYCVECHHTTTVYELINKHSSRVEFTEEELDKQTQIKPKKKKNKLKKRVKELDKKYVDLERKYQSMCRQTQAILDHGKNPLKDNQDTLEGQEWDNGETPHKNVMNPDKTLEERLRITGCEDIDFTDNGDSLSFAYENKEQCLDRFCLWLHGSCGDRRLTDNEIVEKVKQIIEILK